MKKTFSMIALAVLTMGILSSCEKDNGPTSKLPDGALPGEFTVNAKGKTVHFSRGNLYYDGNAFGFETNQYDFNGRWSTYHVSLFFWSKDESMSYAESYTESGTAFSDIFFTNAEAETAKSTFTVNGVTGKYRTLSQNEWAYLLNIRPVNGGIGEGKSYSLNITYGGKIGLVLYPDNYTEAALSGTVQTLPNGVVFLPATGLRNGSGVYEVGKIGGYWASSAEGCRNVYVSNSVYFNSKDVSTTYGDRHDGYSVRLVTESK